MLLPASRSRKRSLVTVLILMATAFAGTALLAPPAAATTFTISGGHIPSQTWTSGNTYLVKGNVTVDAGVVLIVQPNVIVKASNAVHLYIAGSLWANGTKALPITFTNGTAARPWAGIQFNASSKGQVIWSSLSNATTALASVQSAPLFANDTVLRTYTAD